MQTQGTRAALVTGGSQGIGRGIAEALARHGMDVGVMFVGDSHDADAVGENIRAEGRAFWSREADVTNRSEVAEAVESFVSQFGRLDVLVNNAGIIRDRVSWKMSDEEWDDVLATNLTGYFNMARQVIPIMRSGGCGRIVNISSINGLRGKFGQANYSAAKAGVIGLTRTLAVELAAFGITVNAVAPGMVRTAMFESVPEDAKQQSMRGCPMGRPAEVGEIAELVAFLSGDTAGYITGEVIRIDGGLSIC